MNTANTTDQEQQSPPSERLGGDQGNQSQAPSGLQNSPDGAAGTHTPGPWFARTNTAGSWTVKIEDHVYAFDIACMSPGCPAYFQGSTEANARLIAAAPDLLEELRFSLEEDERILDFLAERTAEGYDVVKWVNLTSGRIERTKLLIAKASGREFA